MNEYNFHTTPSTNYSWGRSHVLHNLQIMTQAMRIVGDEHAKFQEHFTDVQKLVEDLKKTYGGRELDVEVIRSTALKPYISTRNLPKFIAFGRPGLEEALKDLRQEEKKLDDLHKKTEELVEALSRGRVASHS